MARLESIALGGFYATPPHLVPRIAQLIAPPTDCQLLLLDPCAGKGDAILDLREALTKNLEWSSAKVYAAEMERTRYEALKEAVEARVSWQTSNILHCDAFNIRYSKAPRYGTQYHGVNLLWLNPPYDYDKVHGRLEQKFLDRFTPCLKDSGVLVFLVPFYALKASAELLAQDFTNLHCFRFPGDDWDAYKQVVLLATKSEPLLEPDPNVVTQVQRWATNADSIPELPESSDPLIRMPEGDSSAFSTWVATTGVDLEETLKTLKPWFTTTRLGKLQPIPGVIPELPLQDMLNRQYPVAMPPRPAHIAAGIAAGVFNGARIEPDSGSKLPPLLIKGCFDKEFRTVDEKVNKDGKVIGLVQVQHPKLVTTVLDLTNNQYHTIAPSVTPSAAETVEDMNTADLLKHYGQSLMGVMLKQCPVMHDPAKPEHNFPLPELPRKLYRAQADATRAMIRLLGGLDATAKERRGRAGFILGEVGSGKTSIALAVMHALKFKRTLVMCPPHLLDGWKEQIAEVTPWARTVVISDIRDVDTIAADSGDTPIIAIVSRETAKLGHGWDSVRGTCPKCGTNVPKLDLAKKRARCENFHLEGSGPMAELAQSLAWALGPISPDSGLVKQLFRSRMQRRTLAKFEEYDSDAKKAAWTRFKTEKLAHYVGALLERAYGDDDLQQALIHLTVASGDDALIAGVASAMYKLSLQDLESYGNGATLRDNVRTLLLTMTPQSPLQTKLAEEFEAGPGKDSRSYYEPWSKWRQNVAILAGESSQGYYNYFYHSRLKYDSDSKLLKFNDAPVGSSSNALKALGILTRVAGFRFNEPCGEILFQASSSPNRYPVATYIAKRHKNLFDFLVLDECHEFNSDGAAQERAAHRLSGLGMPTVAMTGSIMNGYASSLFANMWALSGQFRQEFGRDELQKFVNRYGYRKRLVQEKDEETKEVVAYGSVTDRVETSERMIGNAPGVLPLFLLRHLLAVSVTIHKADLALDLPPCHEEAVPVQPDSKQLGRYESLERALVDQIKQDRFEPELAGKLWGAMAELPSYLDRCTSDVGNTEGGTYEIRYPESLDSVLVASVEPFSADQIMPKEQWMLDKIRSELEEGRNVMVLAWHTNVLPRLSRIIEKELGIKAPILNPNKVNTGKRQAWINKEVVKKKARVLVVNPVAIQTGLNNLVYFSTQIWMQNPACNPITYRQTVGRVDRIGQKLETRIFFPYYGDTTQAQLRELLLLKVGISMTTDGLDAENALAAAGAGDDHGFAGFAVGRQLYDMIANRAA